jgi:hypothetical protein
VHMPVAFSDVIMCVLGGLSLCWLCGWSRVFRDVIMCVLGGLVSVGCVAGVESSGMLRRVDW